MASLTKAEIRLLNHPPSKTTWECASKKHINDGGNPFVLANSGSSVVCWLCRTPKPKRPNLVWRRYIIACSKAKIEPGTRYRPVQEERPMRRTVVRKK